MKQSRIIFVGLLGVAVLLSGCAWLDSLFNPTPELAKPTMTIPAALTSDLSRATGVPSSDAVFEPFRSSLDTAAAVLAQTYLFIDTIGANPIADSVTMPLMDGQRLEVSFDASRTFAKWLEIFKDDAAAEPYLVISYNKGLVKGQIYYNNALSPSPAAGANHIESLLVSYDETIAVPVLDFSAVLAVGVEADTHPTSLYYHGAYADDGVDVAGGLGYHFVFDPNDDLAAFTDYAANHVYMYRAAVSADGSLARTELYFPLATQTTEPDASVAIDQAFLNIVHAWVNLAGNTAVQADLTTAGIGWDDASVSAADFLADLITWRAANPTSTALDNLMFMLELDNPIAYSNETGYVANGDVTELTSGLYSAAALGDLTAIAWPLSPAAIFDLSVVWP